jgi:predicted dehydrogenase
VATPADTHAAVSRDLLRAGVHILVEKPMTVLASDARDLLAEASSKHLVLMPGHIFRYHPAIGELRERISRGQFGDLLFLNTVRTAFSPPRRDVGVLYSLGIHEADLYPYLLGVDYPLEARAHVGGFVRAGIEGVASLGFRFEGGCEGFAFESWLSPGAVKQRRLTVVGTKGAAEVDYQDTRGLRTWETSTDPGDPEAFQEGKAVTVPIATVEPLRAEVEDFLRTATGGGKHRPRVDGTAGLRAVEIIESLVAKGSFVRPRGP